MASAIHSDGPALHIQGRAVHLSRRGFGRPVVLLHGNGSSGDEILRFCPDISDIAWIAPDRPGFGRSDALPEDRRDPVSGAEWLAALIEALTPDRPSRTGVTLVAHSISAGQALICAAMRPDLVAAVVLLAPFCRPTPHRSMPLMRLAASPLVGLPIRYGAIPLLGGLFGRQILGHLLRRKTVPSWLEGLPVARIAGGRTMTTAAAELRAFNDGMLAAEASLTVQVPTCAIWGDRDETAVQAWHLPWLKARVQDLDCVTVPDAGHLIHHDAPVPVLSRIVSYSGRAQGVMPAGARA